MIQKLRCFPKIRSLRHPVNESPAQQPGFFLLIFCAASTGLAGINVRSWWETAGIGQGGYRRP